jgi:hypothetical protein
MSRTTANTISEYNNIQSEGNKKICKILKQEIDKELKESKSMIWHGGPVWFLDDNPVVGHWVRKEGVQLLFWSGQSFDEPHLEPEGKFKASQKIFLSASDINKIELQKWLRKSRDIQWDYKNIVKRKGELERLK